MYSLIPPNDARGTAIKNLLGPKIPGADWRAIGATKPGDGALGSLLNGLIKAVIAGNAPPCGPFSTPQTIDGILETPYYNDAVVTLSSQLGGTVVVDPSHKWFPNLSHAPVPHFVLFKLLTWSPGLINVNVEDSPEVWKQVCQWLSPTSGPLARAAATASASEAAPSSKGTNSSPVQPPLVGFQADELTVARIPLMVPGSPNDSRNPTLRLQPWGFRSGARDYLPANSVQFTTDASGASIIRLDRYGIIHPLRVGTAKVKANYFDFASSRWWTSEVQVNVVDPQQ